jgi:two-component system sensor histidine kinase KdpD
MIRIPRATNPSPANGWSIVIVLLAVATNVCLLLENYVSLMSQAMIYVLAVVIAAYLLDWLKSAVCAVGAVIAMSFFFVPPRWSFAVDSQENLIALGTMLVVALVISRLTDSLRHETEAAHLNERRARQLQALAAELSAVSTSKEILTLGRAALADAFAGPSVLALAQDSNELGTSRELDANVRDGMRACMTEGAMLGPGTGRGPGLEAWYLPLGAQGRTLGVACIRPARATDDGGREHAQALCALLGQALSRLRLTASMLDARSEAQRQQLQSTFLAAISHDLRTPLAIIVGAASALQAQRDKLAPAEQERLLASIAGEASYLSAVTENTLQLVRLASPGQVPQRNWESMEEIIGVVLARVRQHDPDRRIKSEVPQALPLVKADPVLLAQLIGNLLDNALKYSDGVIDLTVSAEPQEMEVCVKDRGPGVAQSEREEIFKPFTRSDRSGRRGSGLGLAVCRAIAQAHGGGLMVRPRAGGGSVFHLTVPLDAQHPVTELS